MQFLDFLRRAERFFSLSFIFSDIGLLELSSGIVRRKGI